MGGGYIIRSCWRLWFVVLLQKISLTSIWLGRIIKEQLRDQVVELTKCPNGNHVIKYCLQTMTPSDNQFIYDALTKDIMDIARHKYGCSMLQRCLDYATEEQAVRPPPLPSVLHVVCCSGAEALLAGFCSGWCQTAWLWRRCR